MEKTRKQYQTQDQNHSHQVKKILNLKLGQKNCLEFFTNFVESTIIFLNFLHKFIPFFFRFIQFYLCT